MWFQPFLHIIYAYMFTLFICLIQIQNTEICSKYGKSAKKYRDMIFAHISSPTLKKCAFGDI